MKKIIYLIIITICFLTISNIEAKTCEYKTIKGYIKSEDYSGGAENCGKVDGCTETKWRTQLFDSSATVQLSASTSVNTEPKFSFKYTFDNYTYNRKNQDIINWSAYIDGVNLSTFIKNGEVTCPNFFLVSLNHKYLYTDGYLVEYLSQEKSMFEYAFNRSKSTSYPGQYFFFFMELQNKESTKEEETTPSYTSCADFSDDKNLCEYNNSYSCLWVSKTYNGTTYEYCNYDDLTYVKCGDAWDLPDKLPAITSFIINFIKIVTPIILIFVSVLSLVKATASSKEEDIKKAQSTLVRRIIAAVIVFFILQITQFVIFKVAEDDEVDNISTCLSCFINNDGCAKNRYYKTMIGGKYKCTKLNGATEDCN